jgi:hypothetical protein
LDYFNVTAKLRLKHTTRYGAEAAKNLASLNQKFAELLTVTPREKELQAPVP